MEVDLSVIHCYDDNYNIVTINYNIDKFKSICKSYDGINNEPICIPTNIKYVTMFLNFLDNNAIIPEKDNEMIELLNIGQFCDLTNKYKFYLLNLIRKRIITRHSISWVTLNKYIVNHSNNMKPFDYETTRYIIQNSKDLLDYICYESVA